MFLRAIQANYEGCFGSLGTQRPKFVRYFAILKVSAVQSNALLFAFSGKFKLKKNRPIRPHFSKSSILIGQGIDLWPAGNFLLLWEQLRNMAITEMTANSVQ